MENEFVTLAKDYWHGFVRMLPKLVITALILGAAFYLGSKLSRLIKRRIARRLRDPILSNFIGAMSKYSIVLIGIIFSMQVLGLGGFASGLMAGAGVSAIILGLAFKDIGENFLSGLILAFNRPFNVGDVIQSENITGSIISLGLRTTTIKTFEGYDVFIPNSMIVNNPLINYNREGMRRFDFTVGIDYEADLTQAKQLILESMKQVDEILKVPEPFVVISELASSSTILKIFFWVNALEAARSLLVIKSEVIELTVRAFKDGGVKIPNDSIQVTFGKGFPEVPVNLVNDTDTNSSKEN